jgi:CRP-like cAMP-binding protein
MHAAVTSPPIWTLGQCAFCASRHKGLCQGVDDDDVDGASALEASHERVRQCDADGVIYAQGDRGEHVFNLISGWVALHTDTADGRRFITDILLPGSLFGVNPPGQVRGHGATAITKSRVCPLRLSKLDKLRHQIPSLNEQYVCMLQRDIRRAFERLVTLARGNAKERVGRLLGGLAVTAAGETPNFAGQAIRMPLTQRLIAEATGITSIHVNRVLRQLREDHVIEFHGGTLTVLDPRKLHALAPSEADSEMTTAGRDSRDVSAFGAWI